MRGRRVDQYNALNWGRRELYIELQGRMIDASHVYMGPPDTPS